MKIIKNIILVVLLFSSVIHADAINNVIRVGKLIKSSKAFSPKKISEFAKILEEIKGTKKLGQVLGKMNLKNELLEDTFMRLAIYRNKIDKVEAGSMYVNLIEETTSLLKSTFGTGLSAEDIINLSNYIQAVEDRVIEEYDDFFMIPFWLDYLTKVN